MMKISKNVLNIILIIAAITALIAGMVLMSGCKGGDAVVEEAASKDDSGAVETTEAEEADEDGGGTIEEPVDEEEAEEEASQENIEEVEETEEIPVEITEEIKAADDYFGDGLYAEAVKEYRDAARMIGDADISQELKDELLAGISQNQQDAENIGETARMHHSSAMTLQYEKRFEEAKAELEAALAIYPKYQTVIDALASLKALMGLE
ncbi:hypothetical protein ACFLQQ_01835 [Actinomycetota bacterium]